MDFDDKYTRLSDYSTKKFIFKIFDEKKILLILTRSHLKRTICRVYLLKNPVIPEDLNDETSKFCSCILSFNKFICWSRRTSSLRIFFSSELRSHNSSLESDIKKNNNYLIEIIISLNFSLTTKVNRTIYRYKPESEQNYEPKKIVENQKYLNNK
ncbi:hypothetical protein BpHYR1_054136 [Brachionus plicatilis]|uniref:Uncharacterized protein n=1 Tax=Brachionus plicatilis TaxID=10195 RepID=A0A3M7S9G9_BRAPC|nr:hypothetical protein BpHYR1_054136 [Brachionus plicatilis]